MKLLFMWGVLSQMAWMAPVQGALPTPPLITARSAQVADTSPIDQRLFRGNRAISNFSQAKKLAVKIHQGHQTTLYCGCPYEGKTVDIRACGYKPKHDVGRATRLEWEHVVPAEAFGQSFKEWREGAPQCLSKNNKPYKGRKCAGKNPIFNRMEADLYNLWPEIGELNGLRSNLSMSDFRGDGQFGNCQAAIEDRKFRPGTAEAKGRVARTYLYMEQAYPGHGIVSGKNQKLFEAWDQMYPVTAWECERGRIIERHQGNPNPVLQKRCTEAKL
jgi:deoxyribonuclease I